MDGRMGAATASASRELPADWRPWTFRRSGVCGAGCGLPLEAGEQGFWNAVTKEVRHAACPPSAATKAGRERSPWTGLPEPKNEWQRLVAYCRACVLRESLSEPAPYEAFADVWAVVAESSEQLLAGTSRSLPVSDAIVRVIAPLTTGPSASPPAARRPARGSTSRARRRPAPRALLQPRLRSRTGPHRTRSWHTAGRWSSAAMTPGRSGARHC